jgi:hypothetical protein
MRSRNGVLFVLLSIALLAPGAAEANQMRGVTEFLPVSARTMPGADTGFAVKAGAPLTVRAFGGVCLFGAGSCVDSPNGDPSVDTTTGAFPLPGAPAGALIARVGDGPWTQVGSGPTAVSGSGNLVFAVNDDSLGNNTGGFLAIFSYECYPGNGFGDQQHYRCGPPGKL